MQYIIGIDGGGTKTACVISESINPIYQCTGGPSNLLINGLKKTSQTIFNLMYECIRVVNPGSSDRIYVYIGTAGAGRKDDAQRLYASILELAELKELKIEAIKVDSDARIALEAAFNGRPGCILISGTGSIMLGKDETDKIFRVGGFGKLIGDEGSGYSLGRKALNAVAKEIDSRGEKTLITKLLFKELNISKPDELISTIYGPGYNIASAAKILIDAAELDDKISLNILNEETDELINHIRAMMEKMKKEKLDVSFIGGNIENENVFSNFLRKKVSEKLPGVSIHKPENPPVIGAILLGQKLIKQMKSRK